MSILLITNYAKLLKSLVRMMMKHQEAMSSILIHMHLPRGPTKEPFCPHLALKSALKIPCGNISGTEDFTDFNFTMVSQGFFGA